MAGFWEGRWNSSIPALTVCFVARAARSELVSALTALTTAASSFETRRSEVYAEFRLRASQIDAFPV
ncbi:hypothetical protein AAFF_G00076030 [Aldrovandia affinis]|uniref:Uncharacterized protein n=1 Tax=Aldrovandia affinis TaxID=143900 RepID=A0AAD7RYE8_9TELE|nr:hypothetical protein AAFF_G00076030 [Aldrovandia affinis]